jgi:hypothetical protein
MWPLLVLLSLIQQWVNDEWCRGQNVDCIIRVVVWVIEWTLGFRQRFTSKNRWRRMMNNRFGTFWANLIQ